MGASKHIKDVGRNLDKLIRSIKVPANPTERTLYRWQTLRKQGKKHNRVISDQECMRRITNRYLYAMRTETVKGFTDKEFYALFRYFQHRTGLIEVFEHEVRSASLIAEFKKACRWEGESAKVRQAMEVDSNWLALKLSKLNHWQIVLLADLIDQFWANRQLRKMTISDALSKLNVELSDT